MGNPELVALGLGYAPAGAKVLPRGVFAQVRALRARKPSGHPLEERNMTSRPSVVGLPAFLRATGLALLSASMVAPPAAADAQSPRRAIAVEGGVRIVTRLNTPRRFHGAVTSLEAVRAMMARPGMPADIEAVFQAAGLAHLAREAVRSLTDTAGLRSVTVAVGTRMEWMARLGPHPHRHRRSLVAAARRPRGDAHGERQHPAARRRRGSAVPGRDRRDREQLRGVGGLAGRVPLSPCHGGQL